MKQAVLSEVFLCFLEELCVHNRNCELVCDNLENLYILGGE